MSGYPTQHRRASYAAPAGVTRPVTLPSGIADIRALPDSEFSELWDSIIIDQREKDRLLAQSLFSFTVRERVSRAVLPLHGIMLLVGPPGTGKTSLAKGLASRTAEVFGGQNFTFIEVDPHALSSSALGKSQKAVTDLFGNTIREHAANGPTIVLLDEVETLVADRSQLSLEANPVDVLRATDAALVQLDHFAASATNVLFVATSNFPRALDDAFVSRADVVISVPLPDPTGRQRILADTLRGFGGVFSAVGKLADSARLGEVVRATEGLDGRVLRKLVGSACALDKDTALDPNRLTIEMLISAAKAISASQREARK